MLISLLLATELPFESAPTSRPSSQVAAGLVRLLDVLVSLALLVLLLPLMFVLAILIRWDSAGPAFYRQERLGRHGKPFQMLKLRTMRVGAEAVGPSWSRTADPRITRIGLYLRRMHLDELPQFWNVLRGDMALIGPRPERRQVTDQLSAYIPHFRSRLLVKPGVTGWAQVHLPEGASIEDARARLAYDLHYVQNRNVQMAARILVRTLSVMTCPAGR